MIDETRLCAWMDDMGLGERGAPIELTRLAGGSQNLILDVRRGGLRAVLRIPPNGAPAQRDAGIQRECTIARALAASDVPHAPIIASCDDRRVLGRPFYLMEFVDGWSPPVRLVHSATASWPHPFDHDFALRPGLAYQVIDGLAAVDGVDWRACGLSDLGRPNDFHERQVHRWTEFFERIKGRQLPGLKRATAWLRAHRPRDYLPGLMHGDFQFANLMYRHGAPAQLAAIVDWEMATIGDPKLDLAWMLQTWPVDTQSPDAADGFIDLRGMPSVDELLGRYSDLTGRQVDDIDYYLVLARWKFAIVLEQGFQRANGDPRLEAFGPIVVDMMARAAELAETSTYH